MKAKTLATVMGSRDYGHFILGEQHLENISPRTGPSAKDERLTENIKKHGQLVPAVVEKDRESGKYNIIDGWRRFKACKESGQLFIYVIKN